MKRYLTAILLCGVVSAPALAQEKIAYYIATNGNLFIPVSSDKDIFPILGYSKKTDPKFLIGGFGVGMYAYKPITSSMSIKGGLSLSRHVYWEEAVELRDQSNNPLGTFIYSSADNTIHLSGMVIGNLQRSFRIGAGLGAQVTVFSQSRLPDRNNSTSDSGKRHGKNNYYKPVLPVVPIEVSYHSKRHLYAIRYEQGLINRYKNSLSEHRKDLFGILSFEYGWRLFDKE